MACREENIATRVAPHKNRVLEDENAQQASENATPVAVHPIDSAIPGSQNHDPYTLNTVSSTSDLPLEVDLTVS